MLALRRSANKHFIRAPGPSPDELDELLRVAARVPDHRRLEPWRFIVFEGEARAAFGKQVAEIYDAANPEATADELMTEAARFERAPVVVAVISSPDTAHKTPVWGTGTLRGSGVLQPAAGRQCQRLGRCVANRVAGV